MNPYKQLARQPIRKIDRYGQNESLADKRESELTAIRPKNPIREKRASKSMLKPYWQKKKSMIRNLVLLFHYTVLVKQSTHKQPGEHIDQNDSCHALQPGHKFQKYRNKMKNHHL